MDNNAGRRIDCQSRSIHDTVVGLNKLNPEGDQIDGLSMLNNLPLGMINQIVLPELILNQSDGQLSGIHRNIYLFQNIRQRSNVILMPMGNHKSLYLLYIIF